jgi:hypothetical protein
MSESRVTRIAACVGCAAFALCVAPARSALAQDDDEGAPVQATPAVRRDGFTVGISGGLAVASASGYRNDVAEIGLPEFEQGTGAAVSGGGAFWVGGSLADWLSISLGVQRTNFSGNGLDAAGAGLHARIELFPLFYRGGAWQDVGVSAFAGTGNVDVKRGKETVAEGEGTSLVGAGVFFEPWRFWQFSTGPELFYTHQFSRSMSAHLLVVGWRLAFYRGP